MQQHKEVTYVNHLGARVAVDAKPPKAKRASSIQTAFHKGWRVVGISPERITAARVAHAKAAVSVEAPFDEAQFIRSQTAKPVRAKPYATHAAALECAELAERAGWAAVHVVEISKGGA